jgi:Rrf2 family protein
MELVKWLSFGSVPAAVAGVALVSVVAEHIGEERLDSLVYAVLGGTLLMVGIITLARALILRNLIDERDRFEVEKRHKVAAIVIGATTGFVIGITSAGSGTVIAILLIAVYRLAPKRVVGTDVFHAAILLSAAGLAHIVAGNVDFGLAANILVGSIPGVIIGSALSDKAPQGVIRTALGLVLVRRGIPTSGRSPPGSPQSASARSSTHRTGSTNVASVSVGKRRTRQQRWLQAPAADWFTSSMRVSAKADYAVRAAAELAAAEEGPIKGERLADAQDIPLQFLEHILLELKHQGIIRARRGAKGGYWLAKPADEVTIADVVRAVEGPIAHVQSTPPEAIEYHGNAESLQKVWIAVRASLRTVLENVTLADLVSGNLPPVVEELIASPDAWVASTGTKEMATKGS